MPVQTSYGNRALAIEGMLADDGPHDIITLINQEASAEMAFGHAVKREGSTEDQGALNPSAETDKIVGIVVHSHAYADDALGTTGVKPGYTIQVLRKGRIWVMAETTGCAPGDRLWVRAVAGAGESIGACENADDSTDTIDCTNQGEFQTTAAADALAILEVDFTSSPTVA